MAVLTALLYAGSVVVGLGVKRLSFTRERARQAGEMAWSPPELSPLAAEPGAASIRRGSLLFSETPIYAPDYARAQLSCSSCHVAAGIRPYAAPMVGLTGRFPAYNARAGRVISLSDRIRECFVRSENGRPLPDRAPEMHDLLSYIAWLSQPEPARMPYAGRGFKRLPVLASDPRRGASIYSSQCAGCHGTNGEGRAPLFPPLWGASSFNDAAGMNSIGKMATFVKHNMPQNRPGILSAQDAYDVAAYVHAHSRPTLDPAYRSF